MFTGLYPSHPRIRNNGDTILADDITTLAEHLQHHGYDTAASVSAFVTTRVWNLDQGFEQYFDDLPVNTERSNWGQERPAEEVVDDLLEWFTKRELNKPYFVWAHFYDPHDPHEAPEQYHVGFKDLYDAEIAYVDVQIKRLLDGFGGDENTIWVLIADHGEAFNHEHNESSHGLYLFDPTMRIPFIIKPVAQFNETKIINDQHPSISLLLDRLLGLPPLSNIDGIDVLSNISKSRDSIYMGP